MTQQNEKQSAEELADDEAQIAYKWAVNKLKQKEPAICYEHGVRAGFKAGYAAYEDKMGAHLKLRSCMCDKYADQITSLTAQNEKLKWQLSLYKVYGTDDCYNYDCKGGRVTLFRANEFCISCDPDGYKTYEELSKLKAMKGEK